MAQYELPDPEDLLECPYDPVHMIRAKRFPYHVMKCRRNYIGRDYGICPFNARHEIPKPELRYHILTCSDKCMIERDIIYEQRQENGQYLKGDTSIPVSDWKLPVDPSDDWETEIKYTFPNQDPCSPCRSFNREVCGERRVTQRYNSKMYNEPVAVNSPLRLPAAQPRVLAHVPNADVSVPSQSLGLAGIGRGKAMANIVKKCQDQIRPGGERDGAVHNVVMKTLARGKGIGRGLSIQLEKSGATAAAVKYFSAQAN